MELHTLRKLLSSAASHHEREREREKASNPKLIGRMRGAKKKKSRGLGQIISLSLSQLLTDGWKYEMRLRNEKYSYFL